MNNVHLTDLKYKEWKEGKIRLFKVKYVFRIKLGGINGVPSIDDIKKRLSI